jgi:hypothetical protein
MECLAYLSHSIQMSNKRLSNLYYPTSVSKGILDKLHNNGFTFSCASPLVYFFVVPCQNILRTCPMIATKWFSHCNVGEV